ncbi:CAMK family protein kinase [Tritrichomonas foetus]|uniref:CAMK family protein kinase n=1 Tax=Tritrichomonas foetus TaxID=1144522 RepID=A0A1J4KTP4_9EUKA|nr:CAMK family protein kinase [Tritrichomonas foetus]|eukprot:OHT14631.1 CAMK family protein kinase [Tritrichomonas foetus]
MEKLRPKYKYNHLLLNYALKRKLCPFISKFPKILSQMTKIASVPSKILRLYDNGNHDTYNVRHVLGQGGFGTVFEVFHLESGKKFAIKAIPLANLQDKSLRQKQRDEIEIQQALNHENILKCYQCFQDEFNLYILLELCPYHSVNRILKKRGKLTEFETADILFQVMQGIKYLHDQNVIHRDLKLENFLIGSDGKVKIADFGVSVILSSKDEKRFSICGTKGFMPPEMVNEQSDGHSYEVDIWSVGVCAFLLLTGHPPFQTRDAYTTEQKIKACEYRIPADLKLSFVAKDFIQSILQVKPENRPTIDDLLRHPFIAAAQKTPHESVLPKVPVKIESNNEGDQSLIDINLDQEIKPKNENKVKFENGNPIRNNENVGQINDKMIPNYCVSKWCDKSVKTGFIYMMRNGAVGIVTPDLQRFVMDPHEEFVQIWTKTDSKIPGIIKLSEYPLLKSAASKRSRNKEVDNGKDGEANKGKITDIDIVSKPMSRNLSKYISKLLKYAKAFKTNPDQFEIPKEKLKKEIPLHHVKYWLKNETGMLLRMDNRMLQVNFPDRNKLIVFWEQRMMIFTKSLRDKGDFYTFSDLSSTNNDEVKKRFAITKDLIEHMNNL